MSNDDTRRVTVPTLLLLAAGVFSPSVATAQDSPESPAATEEVAIEDDTAEAADEQRARDAYLRGRTLFEQRKYEESAEAFDEAYQLSKRPLLLLSIASAHERGGRFDLALRTLRAYRPYANPTNAGEVDYRIASLEERMETVEAREPDPNPSVAVSTQPASPARSFNWPAWTTGAVGVAAQAALWHADWTSSAPHRARARPAAPAW